MNKQTIVCCGGQHGPGSGMGIVPENAHFHNSETDFPQRERKKIVYREKKLVVQKEKKEAPVLILHQIPTKHTEHVHMQLSPVLVM